MSLVRKEKKGGDPGEFAAERNLGVQGRRNKG